MLGKRHQIISQGRVTLHLTAYRRRLCRDNANLIGGAKGLIDAIVREKIIQDDDDQHVLITYEQHLASKSPTGKPCTVIRWGAMEGGTEWAQRNRPALKRPKCRPSTS